MSMCERGERREERRGETAGSSFFCSPVRAHVEKFSRRRRDARRGPPARGPRLADSGRQSNDLWTCYGFLVT